ncbi:amyloid fiber anchoring/assembly protein TapA [Rossellomorea oryzaecorticis]|uniref:Amyloid fiber anchoring/assembly protein TapA n=1 Tax=Rossellomorea oryzaecorticis TaxID=1396505 RepID=A0ABW8VUW7_9BACI
MEKGGDSPTFLIIISTIKISFLKKIKQFIFFKRLNFFTYPKDVIPIRFPRTRKHKTPFKKWKLLCQLMAIWYATTITSSFLDGSTGAYFNDQDQVSGVITTGTWSSWDKSSLSFPNKDHERSVEACTATEISVSIKNTGSTMEGPTEYAVYYAASGNPMNGNSIFNGNIQPIDGDSTTTLSLSVNEPGNYKFKALQRPGHGNKEDTRHELWSETITITCVQETLKDEGKGGGKTKPEPPKKNDKQEEQEVTVPKEKSPEQSKEENKEQPAPPVEEKPAPEEPPAPAEPEPEPAKETEAKTASEPKTAPPVEKEEPVDSTPDDKEQP